MTGPAVEFAEDGKAGHGIDRIPSDDPIRASRTHYDVIIIGSGILGSSLATSLALSGRRVLLFERDLSLPDRIVGELLQPGGCISLRKLGPRFESCLDDIDAIRVGGYKVFWGSERDGGRQVGIPYPDEKIEMSWSKLRKTLVPGSEEEKGLRDLAAQKMGWKAGDREVQEGRSFHHGRFVQKLRRMARETAGVTIVEATVNDLIKCPHTQRVIGVEATPKSSPSPSSEPQQSQSQSIKYLASLTIISDGCFSKFRRLLLPPTLQPVIRSNFVGLILENPVLPAPGCGHVILHKKKEGEAKGTGGSVEVGPVLVYQIGSGETRMLVDVPGKKVPGIGNGEMKAYLEKNVLPSLPASIVPSFQATLASQSPHLRPRSMPNSYLPPTPQSCTPLECSLLVGDAMNMRHPLTGGGMTVALNDVVILTSLLGGGKKVGDVGPRDGGVVDLEEWDIVKDRLDVWHEEGKNVATCINVLAQALYQLFGADDENLEVLKEGCFKYFELGGECVSGPVSLLSALTPSRLLLLYHFFSVALYSIYLLFARPGDKTRPSNPAGPLEWPGLVRRSCVVFYVACVVILPVLWAEC